MMPDEELRDAMLNLESDSPSDAEVAATVRARLNGNHRFRNTALASVAAAAAVAAIVITTSILRSPTQPNQIQPVSPPPSQASSAPVSVSAPQTSPPISSSPTPPAISAPIPAGEPPAPDEGSQLDTGFARCYTTADLNTERNYLGISQNGGPISGPDAIGICQQNWEAGILFATPPYIRDQPAGPGQIVPDLVACVLPAQVSDNTIDETVVFPGTEQTCAQLGLPQFIG